MKDQNTEHCGKGSFQAHDERGNCRGNLFLSYGLEGETNGRRKHSRIQDGQHAGSHSFQGISVKDRPEDQGKSTAYHQLAEGKDHTAVCSDVMVQGHYLEGIDHR